MTKPLLFLISFCFYISSYAQTTNATQNNSNTTQETGSTGQPVNWVQIGELKDTILQIDANSILGFNAPQWLAHKADVRFKGKDDENLTSQKKTAFMRQTDCDVQQGSLSMFITNSDGQAIGDGETYNFDLKGEMWTDAVARAMCKARKLMIENSKLVKAPNPDNGLRDPKARSTDKNNKSRNIAGKESIQTIRDDTIDALNGRCMATIVQYKTLLPKEFEENAKNYTEKQNAWIREQGKRGNRLMPRLKNFANKSNEEVLRSIAQDMNKPDAEFLWAYFTIFMGIKTLSQEELPVRLALSYISACEDAKFHTLRLGQ